MAGVLSFTLGLEASNFMRNIGVASGGVLSLAAAGRGLQVAMDGVWSAIERGGALNDLSNRTGESVRNLYQLEEAFKVIGISSDATGPMILKLQRALSGTSETGEKTDKMFSAIGLNIADLSRLDAPAQISAIATALAGLNKNDATEIASRIFGREGAGNIVQISRDMAGFRSSLRDSRASADVFARTAGVFDTIGDTVTTIKMKLGGFWAGAAEGAAPAIQAATDFINALDFARAGQGLGLFLRAIANAFGSGELTLLISDSIRLGFETAIDFLPGLFEKLGVMILNVFKTPLNYIQAFYTYMAQKYQELLTLGKVPADSWSKIIEDQKANGPQFFAEGNNLEGANADANARLGSATAAFKERFGKFWEGVQEIAGPNSNFTVTPKAGGKDLNRTDLGNAGSARKTEGSALEKIGFVFNGGRTVNDHSRDTASNTRRTNELLIKLPKALAAALPQGSGSFANI